MTAKSATAAARSSGQERQYLVAGQREALPDREAIAAAGGVSVDQIASIGVTIARSSNPEFLAVVGSDPSVSLASLDLEAQEVAESERSAPAEVDLAAAADLTEPLAADDPLYHLQWPHRAMGVDQVHARGITGKGVRVAVVDSGIYCQHEDLRDRCVPGISFVPTPDGSGLEPWDAPSFHGTAMAGVIAATAHNGVGVHGVAPEASLVSVRVSPGSGVSFPWSRVAQGYDWASSVGQADIINASHIVTVDLSDPEESEFLGIANRLLALVYRRGVVLFASAGNDNLNLSEVTNPIFWPASHSPRVVTVGATAPCGAALNGNVLDDFYDNKVTASNYGFDQSESRFLMFPSGEFSCNRNVRCQVGTLQLPCQRFDQTWTTAAPGVPQLNGYTVVGNTSPAAATASGVAALILSRYPDMKPGQLVDTILNTAVDLGAPGYDSFFGYGRGSASWLE